MKRARVPKLPNATITEAIARHLRVGVRFETAAAIVLGRHYKRAFEWRVEAEKQGCRKRTLLNFLDAITKAEAEAEGAYTKTLARAAAGGDDKKKTTPSVKATTTWLERQRPEGWAPTGNRTEIDWRKSLADMRIRMAQFTAVAQPILPPDGQELVEEGVIIGTIVNGRVVAAPGHEAEAAEWNETIDGAEREHAETVARNLAQAEALNRAEAEFDAEMTERAVEAGYIEGPHSKAALKALANGKPKKIMRCPVP